MKKIFSIFIFSALVYCSAYSQSSQSKAETLIGKYFQGKYKKSYKPGDYKFSQLAVLRSSYDDTKPYQSLLHKVDSLKWEGKKIDAHIAKMKTTTELNAAKKDSHRLSQEMVATSDKLINYMTEYKGKPVGWRLTTTQVAQNRKRVRDGDKKVFFLNEQISKIDSTD